MAVLVEIFRMLATSAGVRNSVVEIMGTPIPGTFHLRLNAHAVFGLLSFFAESNLHGPTELVADETNDLFAGHFGRSPGHPFDMAAASISTMDKRVLTEEDFNLALRELVLSATGNPVDMAASVFATHKRVLTEEDFRLALTELRRRLDFVESETTTPKLDVYINDIKAEVEKRKEHIKPGDLDLLKECKFLPFLLFELRHGKYARFTHREFKKAAVALKCVAHISRQAAEKGGALLTLPMAYFILGTDLLWFQKLIDKEKGDAIKLDEISQKWLRVSPSRYRRMLLYWIVAHVWKTTGSKQYDKLGRILHALGCKIANGDQLRKRFDRYHKTHASLKVKSPRRDLPVEVHRARVGYRKYDSLSEEQKNAWAAAEFVENFLGQTLRQFDDYFLPPQREQPTSPWRH
jgi:hypothetical protein